MYLLDTNVISAVAPTKKDRPADLVAWLDAASDALYLSAVTAAEVHDGIAKAAREGATRKAALLAEWWGAVEHLYGSRILPFDLQAARRAGVMMDRARGAGTAPGFADVAIASTAEAHGLTVVTRNVRHFEPLGVQLVNPFEELPPLPGSG